MVLVTVNPTRRDNWRGGAYALFDRIVGRRPDADERKLINDAIADRAAWPPPATFVRDYAKRRRVDAIIRTGD